MPTLKVHEYSPPDGTLPAKEWAELMSAQIIHEGGRSKASVFKNFPPQYIDYYQELQNKIADKIPDEQKRPLIVLKIAGSQRLNEHVSDIGLAGGTGPLSDATIIGNLVKKMSGIEHESIHEHRETIAKKMSHFTAVLYSMPPPRDLMRAASTAFTYRDIYRDVRTSMPSKKLHILTNTGHSNKWVFNKNMVFGTNVHGKVDDMTKKVSDLIARDSTNRKVLVLGTIAAHQARLYPELLDKRNVPNTLPKGLFNNQSAKIYLQEIIDQAKSGAINSPMKGKDPTKTCGDLFVEFAVHYAKKTQSQSLLFSCTEIPMLLHTEKPDSGGKTYFDILKEKLASSENTVTAHDGEALDEDEEILDAVDNNSDYEELSEDEDNFDDEEHLDAPVSQCNSTSTQEGHLFYDTEELFINIIADNSATLQAEHTSRKESHTENTERASITLTRRFKSALDGMRPASVASSPTESDKESSSDRIKLI